MEYNSTPSKENKNIMTLKNKLYLQPKKQTKHLDH